MTSGLIKRGNLETDTKQQDCHAKVEDTSGLLSTSQGMPKVASNHQKLGERHGTDSSLQHSEGTSLADTLI